MSSGIQQRRKGTTKTTKEILDTLHYCGENNHSIPLSGAVQFEEAELPIPAYIFGAWLGDGHSETARIEVIKRFSDYAETIGAKFRVISCNYGSKAKTYSISGGENLHIKLKSLGVLKNKHIPEIYLLASIEQRRELLRGLMDTDGCIDARKPCCEIIQKRKSLALEIMRIIRSLGMACSLSEKIVKERSYWRITFRANFNCFTIKRKSDRYKEQKKNNASASRFIVSVTPVVTRPVRCITVDSQSHLYLASESFVPTHNSTPCFPSPPY